MTRWSSSTFFLARPKVPSCRKEYVLVLLCLGNKGRKVRWVAYSLLGELTGALVLAVSEQFDDSALVGGEAIKMSMLTVYSRMYNRWMMPCGSFSISLFHLRLHFHWSMADMGNSCINQWLSLYQEMSLPRK